MATRYKSVEVAEFVPLVSFQSDPGAQSNMTDPDSRIMKKSTHAEYTQSYNAHAVVGAEVSMTVQGFRAPRTPHPSGQSPAMALSLRRPVHPGSPSRCQNLKRNRLLGIVLKNCSI